MGLGGSCGIQQQSFTEQAIEGWCRKAWVCNAAGQQRVIQRKQISLIIQRSVYILYTYIAILHVVSIYFILYAFVYYKSCYKTIYTYIYIYISCICVKKDDHLLFHGYTFFHHSFSNFVFYTSFLVFHAASCETSLFFLQLILGIPQMLLGISERRFCRQSFLPSHSVSLYGVQRMQKMSRN